MRLHWFVAATLVVAIGCGQSAGNGSTSGSGKSLIVTASPAAVVADGKNTILVHVEGTAKAPVNLVTSRGYFESSNAAIATFDATPFDAVLHTCDAAKSSTCVGSVIVQAADKDLVSGAATVVFADVTTGGGGGGTGTGGGSGTGGSTDGGTGADGGTSGTTFALSLVASATRIPATSTAQAVLTAGVTANGAPAAGRTVTFTQSGAPVTLSSPTVTDANGATSVTLTANASGGTTVVTATDAASGQKATVTIEMPQLGQITVAAQDFQVQGVRSSGFQEVNLITFELRDTSGKTYPAGLQVDFSHQSLYDSFIGSAPNCTGTGPVVCSATGVTDDQGQVVVALTSGKAAGLVSVSAASKAGGLSARAAASNVAVVGAKASGAHVTIDCTPRNIPALSDNDCSYSHYAGPGSNVTCTATFADRFNNVLGVPTLTTFLSEAGNASAPSLTDAGVATGAVVVTGGRLPDRELLGLVHFENEPTASVGNGCGAKGSPRAGLVTVVAMAPGEEGFVDLNGNGQWDTGEPFVDTGEPYVDVNDNGVHDDGEPYVDVNHNGKYDGPNGVWDSDTVIWAETRILYTDQPAVAPDGSLSRVTPAAVAVAGGTSATSQLVGIAFMDENMNPVSPGVAYDVATQAQGVVTATLTRTPSKLDNLGMSFSQLYCDKKPGDAGAAHCSNSCVSSPCYVVTNVGSCDLTNLADPKNRFACGGFSNIPVAAAEVKGTCSKSGADKLIATATLNDLVTRVSADVTCTVPPSPPVLTVTLTAGPMAISSSGEASTLTAVVTQDGQPVAGRTVSFSALAGTVTPIQPTTDATGVATARFTSTASGGGITVTATDDASGKIAQATVTLPTYAVALSMPGTAATASGQTATVTAVVTANGQAITGRRVTFAAPGAAVVVLNGTTDVNGSAKATITSTGAGSGVSVTATDAISGQSATLAVTPPTFAVTVIAAAMVPGANGHTASVSARVTANGLPVAGRAVTFAAPGAQLTNTSPTTDADGLATATLGSTVSGGNATVSVTDVASGQVGKATVAMPVYVVVVSAPKMTPGAAGESTTVTATLTADGVPLAGRAVQFSAPGALVTVVRGTTDGSGTASAIVTSTDSGGAIVVTATDAASGVAGTSTLTLPVYALQLTSTSLLPTPTGQQSTITALLTADGKPVPGRRIDLALTGGGALSLLSGTTAAGGVVTSIFTSSAPGVVTVTAVEQVSAKTAQVDLVMPVYQLDVVATPVVAKAANATATVSATLKADGQPVPGRTVTFTSSDSQVIPNDTTTGGGVATASFASTSSGGSVTVSAAESVSGQHGQVVLALPVYAVAVTAGASTIDENGNVTTPIQAVLTADAQPLAGRTLTFQSTLPIVANAGPTDAAGVMTATVTQAPSDPAGDVTVTDPVSSQKGVATVAKVPRVGNITVANQEFPVQGVKNSGYHEASAITFQVNDVAGNPFIAGLRVDFTHVSIFGSSVTPAFAATDATGKVVVTLRSGTAAGNASVVATATAGGATSKGTAKSVFVGALPNAAHIAIDCTPKNIPAFVQNDCQYSYYVGPGTQATCTATLADVYGNTIGIPTHATFLSEAGKISGGADADASGVATATLDVSGGRLPKDVGNDPVTDPLFTGEDSRQVTDACGARNRNPRDGLSTIIVMVRGQQQFVDVNGNGVYDGPNSPNLQDPKYAAFKVSGEPYVDQGEPFVDYNDDGIRQDDEPYVDVNGNGGYDPPGTDGVYKNDTVVWAETRIVYTGEPDPNEFRFVPATDFALFADPTQGDVTALRPLLVGDGNKNQVSSLSNIDKFGVSWSVDTATPSDGTKVTAAIVSSADMLGKVSNQLPVSVSQLFCSIADPTSCSVSCTETLSPCFPKVSLGFYAPEALPRVAVSCKSVAPGLGIAVRGKVLGDVPVSATLSGGCQ